MQPNLRFALSALLLCSCIIPNAKSQTVTLGILEEVPGSYYKEPSSRHVRVVFRNVGGKWEAFPSNCPDVQCLDATSQKFPDEIHWNISFDGRYVGRITARTQHHFAFYSHIGLQNITSHSPVPTVGAKSEAYGGFLGATVYRPLIANSRPYFKDPDSWKPTHLSQATADLLRVSFRRKSPKLCRQSEDETKLEAFLYKDEDIKVVKAYSSNKRWSIAQLQLESAVPCEDEEAGFGIPDRWFTIDPRGTATYLDQAMWMVDAGDYDNNGRSELIFSIDGYNRGGYKIFYDDFTKSATFEYSYH